LRASSSSHWYRPQEAGRAGEGEYQPAIVRDAGVAGRSIFGELQRSGIGVHDPGVAGHAGTEETQQAIVRDAGVAGRAGMVEVQAAVVGDGGAAAIDDDAGAEKLHKCAASGDVESVIRRPGIECPAADFGVGIAAWPMPQETLLDTTVGNAGPFRLQRPRSLRQ
jgi:hypothetical protein